jgi:hypothetical protein
MGGVRAFGFCEVHDKAPFALACSTPTPVRFGGSKNESLYTPHRAAEKGFAMPRGRAS